MVDGTDVLNHYEALLDKGAKVDLKTRNGITPLRMAVSRVKNYPIECSVEVIKLLLDAGADPNETANEKLGRQNIRQQSIRIKITSICWQSKTIESAK